MNYQLKYRVTYGHSVEAKHSEVYAFDIVEAVEIANKVNKNDPALKRVTKVEQISDLKEFSS